jgi:phenylacetate-CoA ligase
MKDKIKVLLKTLIPNYWRYIPCFQNAYNKVVKFEKLSREEVLDLQEQQLKKLLIHCYKNVPYYNKILEDLGINPIVSRVSSFELLKKLPILTKDEFRKHLNEFISVNRENFKSSWKQTSGSTGKPTKYMQDRNLDCLISAIVFRHYEKIGYKGGYIAVFRGTMVDEFGKSENTYKIESNQIHFSTFNMNEKTMLNYIEILNKYKPEIIRGYPSSLLILFNFAKENNLYIYPPKAIHTSSEVLPNELRNIVKYLFNVDVYDYYSQGEAAIIAYQLPNTIDTYKYLPYFSYVEFADINENHSSIIGTNLWNYSMPLLRYETEDLTTTDFIDEKNFTIRDIIGRKADIIYGKNGVIVSPISFYHYWKHKIDKILNKEVSFYQVIQKKDFNFVVRVLKEKDIEDEKTIIKNLKDLLGDINVEFEYLDKVPTGQKWRTTVREVNGSKN